MNICINDNVYFKEGKKHYFGKVTDIDYYDKEARLSLQESYYGQFLLWVSFDELIIDERIILNVDDYLDLMILSKQINDNEMYNYYLNKLNNKNQLND